MHFTQVFSSSIGKKFLLAVTGLSWTGFAIGHLIGNLQLLSSNPAPFNKYGHFLISLGGLLYIVESILAASLLIHIAYAIKVTLDNWKTRPVGYVKSKSPGGVSKRGLATATMIFTGLLLAVFLTLHIMNFKFGAVYMTTVDGEQIRDLYRTVYEYYASPLNTFYYVFMMILIGIHLSHGAWSAFQSLGIAGKRFTPFIYKTGFALSILVSIGFVVIPIYVHFMGGTQ